MARKVCAGADAIALAPADGLAVEMAGADEDAAALALGVGLAVAKLLTATVEVAVSIAGCSVGVAEHPGRVRAERVIRERRWVWRVRMVPWELTANV